MKLCKPLLLGAILAKLISAVNASEAEQSAIAEQEIVFSNGPVALSATLLAPRREGKSPGVVIIHGSGDSDRSNPWTRAYANALSKLGVAVLHPDKRGCGKSQGDWRKASLVDLADDALAAVEFLRKHPQVNGGQVGLIGFSQGGHVAPAAASRDSNVAFAIDISGSVLSMADQMADEVEMSAERAGLSTAQIKLVGEIHAMGLRFVETGDDDDWKRYESALAKTKEGELKANAVLQRFPSVRQHPALDHLRAIVRYDPMPYWQKVSVPSLFVFGGKDTQLRAAKSMKRLESELPADKFNYTVMFFSKNGHALYREDLNRFLARWITDGGKP